MVNTFLRRFLLIVLSVAPALTHTNPTEETSAQTIFQEKMSALQNDLTNIQQILKPEQFACLQTILEQFQAYTALLLVNEATEEPTIKALIAAQGNKITKEELMAAKQTMMLALQQQQVPLEIAQKFFATLLEMTNLQKQAIAAIQAQQPALATTPTELSPEQKNEKIAQILMSTGPLVGVFLLDAEADAKKISAYINHAKKLEVLPAELEVTRATEQVAAAKKILLESGATLADAQAVFNDIKAQCTEQIAQQIKGLMLPLSILRLTKEELVAAAKELSKKHNQEITVEMVQQVQQQLRVQKFIFGITAKEIQGALDSFSAEQRKYFWRKFGLAAVAATTMGTADLFIQAPKHIAKTTGSIFNKLFGTTMFYSQEDPSRISTSPAGIWGRLLQLASKYPAGILYKENSFDKLVNTQDPALQLAFAQVGEQMPILKKAVKAAPFLIQVIPEQQEATVENAFAEVCGPTMGTVSNLTFQKFAPLLVWIGIKCAENKALIQTSQNFFNFFVNDDETNAWNSAAFATAPLVKSLLSSPFDELFGKLAPKNGVFLRSLLSSGWGSRLVEIGYQTAVRHQLHNQFHGKTDALWIKPDFGKDLKRTTRTSKYTWHGKEKTHKEVFVGTEVPPAKESPYKPTTVETKTEEGFLSECSDLTPEEVAKYAPNTKSFWKKDDTCALKGSSSHGADDANTAAIEYAKSAMKNLLTEQVTKSALVTGCFVLNDKIAKFGKATAQKIANLALRLGLIKKSTRKGLDAAAKNAQEFVHIGTGLWGLIQSTVHNRNELLQNPEALAKIGEKLASSGLNNIAPQTQALQIMVHKMFIDKLYKHTIQHLLHKGLPTWVTPGESTTEAGANVKKLFERDFFRNNVKNFSDVSLSRIEKGVNTTATISKLLAYTTLWLAATSVLSCKPEPKKPAQRKQTLKPTQEQPAVDDAMIDELFDRTNQDQPTPVSVAA